MSCTFRKSGNRHCFIGRATSHTVRQAGELTVHSCVPKNLQLTELQEEVNDNLQRIIIWGFLTHTQ